MSDPANTHAGEQILSDALENIKTYAEIEMKLAQNAQDAGEAWARGVFATIAQIAGEALAKKRTQKHEKLTIPPI